MLFSAACSKKADTTETGTGSTTGATAPQGVSIDYSTLSGTINGSGSTFQKAFDEEAITAMKAKAPGVINNYAGGGSGKGKQDLADQVVDWAGTDSTVKPEELGKYKGGAIFYFPTVAAPITVSYNLSGVNSLNLSAPTLAKIFEGKIKTWDDAAIKADNPSVNLPSTAITVAHRSDGSGTTSNFTKYLKTAAGPDWTLDAGDTVQWPADTQAGNGNNGVAQIVKSTAGAIGYVDFSDAKGAGLVFAAIKNKAGKFVAPTLAGASAAVASADVKDDLTYSPLDAAGDDAYPITAPTWIITYQKIPDATKGNDVKGWINFALTEGQALAPAVDFAALPQSMQQKAVAQLAKLQVG
ncbi:MAG: phosphate ABC transporter substrate-binding protein PstS [Actinobacteria bacterium]|nr:phosphate ABC transporter substrate-binding protein PstS [Actinomycetota bacterium]